MIIILKNPSFKRRYYFKRSLSFHYVCFSWVPIKVFWSNYAWTKCWRLLNGCKKCKWNFFYWRLLKLRKLQSFRISCSLSLSGRQKYIHSTKQNKLSGQIGKEQHFLKAFPTRVNKFLSAKLGGERGKFNKARVGQCFHFKRKTFSLITFLCNKLLL